MSLAGIIEGKFVAGFDVEMVAFQLAEADFRALKVLDNGDRTTFFSGSGANPGDLLVALHIITVRKVQATTVDAGHN